MLHMNPVEGYLSLDANECRELGRTLAAQYGASVEEETSDPRQAYTRAGFALSRRARPSYWGRLPWAD